MRDTEKHRFYPSKKKAKDELGEVKYFEQSGMVGEPAGAYWSSENKAYMDILTIKQLFQSEDWVYLAVDAIAHPISTLPLCVYRETIVDGELVHEKAMDHPINTLLNNPNQWVSGSEFKYSVAADYILAGNSYMWKGDASNLYHIPAEKVLYRFGKSNMPDGYYIVSDFEDGIPIPEFEVELKDMAHTKRPNPSSAIYGLSPFAPAKRSVLFNRYSQEYINNFYLKGATPQMLLSLDKTADRKSINRLGASFEQAYIGRRNQRRTMVLPKGVSASPIENKIADQSLLDLMEMNTDRILATLKIQPHIVGRQKTGSMGSEEMKQAHKYFWQTTITDTATAIADKMTELYKPELAVKNENYKFIIKFDFENVPELQDDLDKKADTLNKLLTVMSVNELRAKFLDLDPIEGGEGLQSNQQMANPYSFMQPKKKAISKQDIGDSLDRVEKEMLDLEETVEPSRKKAATELLLKQNIAAIEILRKLAKEKDISIDKDSYTDLLLRAYEDMQDQYINAYMNDLTSVSKLGSEQQLELMIVSTDTNEEAINAINDQGDSTRYRILENRGIESFVSIRSTTLDRVMDRIEDGINQGSSIVEVEESIKDYFKNNTVWRANTVARTETLQALTVGQEVVFDLSLIHI